jgi:O-antigen ligase
MPNKVFSFDWHTTILSVLISGMFLSFVLQTLFVQTLMLWLLGGFAVYTGIRTRKFYFQWYSVFFLAIFLMRVLALWRQPELKFSSVELSLSFVLFPLIFSLIKISEKQWVIIQKIVVIGFSAFFVVILYNFVIHIYFENLVRETLENAKWYYPLYLKSPFLYHPSYLAVILAPSIPMCFNLAAKSGKQWQQWLWLMFIPLHIFIVFAIGSRVGLFICAGLIILCSVCFFKNLNLFSKIVLGLGFVAAIGVFSLSNINYTEDPIRKEMNAFAIEKIKERPVSGYGYKTKHFQLNDEGVKFQNPFITELAHFHNSYLDEMFQFGFIGAAPLYLLLLYLFYLAIRKRNVFLSSFLVIYLLFFYVEYPLVLAKGVMPLMLLISVAMNLLIEKKIYPDEKKQI